jgi:hypothetical protein
LTAPGGLADGMLAVALAGAIAAAARARRAAMRGRRAMGG